MKQIVLLCVKKCSFSRREVEDRKQNFLLCVKKCSFSRREVEDRKQIVLLCVKKCSFSRREVEDRGAGSSVETNQWGREDRTGDMIGYLRNRRI